MSASGTIRRLAAIVAADVAGYSTLMGADEEGTLIALKSHQREVFDPKVNEFGGRIVKTTGDGILMEFSSVVDALSSPLKKAPLTGFHPTAKHNAAKAV